MQQTVSAANMKISNTRQDSIIAKSLGSGVGLVIYDPVVNAGGILRYLLPDSSIDKAKAQKNPFIFADTAIPAMLKKADDFGINKTRITVYAAGGAQIIGQQGFENIGEQNFIALEKILAKNDIQIAKKKMGGNINWSIRLSISTGKIYIKTHDSESETLVLLSGKKT